MVKDNIRMITIATYSTIYENEKKEKNEIIKEIQKYDMRKLLIGISILNNSQNEEPSIRTKYLRYKKINKQITDRFNNNILFSKQGLLLLSKWVVAYGVNLESEYLNNEFKDLENIIDLQLFTADYLPTDDIYSKLSYLYKNLALNTKRKLFNDIARSHYIFVELSKDKSKFKSSEYMDFNFDYSTKHGHTIEEYNAIIFSLERFHINANILPIFNSEDFSKKMLNPKLFDEIISNITIELHELKKWAIESINNAWDFTKFLEYPLIKLDDQHILSLNEDSITNLSFEGLYYRIRHVYPNNDTAIITFLGRPFEKYVGLLTENAVNESNKDNYQFIPEFKYGKGDGFDSSDSYIKIGHTLIAIEAKAKRPVFTTLFTDDDTKIFNGIRTIYSDPVLQAFKAFNSIMESSKSNLFEDIQEIYIISVSLMGIPRISEVQEIVKANIEGKLGAIVVGNMNLNIEEFECFCSLVGQGVDVLNLLNGYCNENGCSPFLNFINSKLPNNINNNLKWVDQNFNRFVVRTSQILFNI